MMDDYKAKLKLYSLNSFSGKIFSNYDRFLVFYRETVFYFCKYVAAF